MTGAKTRTIEVAQKSLLTRATSSGRKFLFETGDSF